MGGTLVNRTRFVKFFKPLLPGLALVSILALFAHSIGKDYPIIGGAIIAILIGILLKNAFEIPSTYEKGIDYTLKKLLKFAIILLGFSLSFTKILSVGAFSLAIVLVSVVSGLLLTYFIGRAFGLHGNTATLIGVGTAICGATAIATISPIIKAKEEELTYAINTIFAFNILAVLLYPFLGQLFDMSSQVFGIWAGSAIHDTSSVVAAAFTYSDDAGEIALVVKLVRTLMLIPVALLTSFFVTMKLKKGVNGNGDSKVKIHNMFPYFIFIFSGAAVLNTFMTLPSTFTTLTTITAKFLILMVMASVGLKTDLRKIKEIGYKPLIVGLLASILMGMITIGLIYMFI